MPLTYRGHSLGQRCGICEHLSPTQSVPGIDRWLACEVELSSTLQASRRLSAMKIFYVNIICGDLRRYAATKSQVGRRHMRTRLYCTIRVHYHKSYDCFNLTGQKQVVSEQKPCLARQRDRRLPVSYSQPCFWRFLILHCIPEEMTRWTIAQLLATGLFLLRQ